MTATWPGDLLIVGAGLIGTSLGLAATGAGARVWLRDADAERAKLAASLGAGRVWTADAAPATADLLVAAVPPRSVGPVLIDALTRELATTVTHVSSVQSLPEGEVETAGCDLSRFVGSHPVAGREVSGPEHASADLFRDRPWVVCPTARTAPEATDTVVGLARACGATPVLLDAATHDRVLARLSHVPQLVASALAGTLTALTPADAALAGTGIRDATRLADSDPDLWAQIVAANAAPVAAGLREVVASLQTVADRLETTAPAASELEAAVRMLVTAGRAGRALLPGKHGRPPTAWAVVHVVIPDRPGALADLLAAVAAEEVNVEDIRVDHASGQPLGVAELSVPPSAQGRLVSALEARGWSATRGSASA